MARNIVFLIFDQFLLLDAAGPIAAFEMPIRHMESSPYVLQVVGPKRGLTRSSASVAMHAESMNAVRELDTLVVVGGPGAPQAAANRRVLDFIRRQAPRARRVCSVCSGAYVLAAAGVLNGRRATTHWSSSAEFSTLFPQVKLESDRIYIRDGNVWTSGGSSAGIDLALALIADDLGEAVAKQVARVLVVYYRRTGGQSQFSTLLDATQTEGRFAPLLTWIREHLHEPVPVERLAQQAHMSPRNFARAFSRETGMTPAKMVEKVRLELAQERVEAGADPMDVIARDMGFGDMERMRRAFLRAFGLPPQAVRRAARSSLEPTENSSKSGGPVAVLPPVA
ncbi:MAG TPA: GlxA family transcriptional regulator [Rhodocyclaceae bacterium]|nr:GlxA family transcriptional regulator [Rhodocyclaceae bacterium]